MLSASPEVERRTHERSQAQGRYEVVVCVEEVELKVEERRVLGTGLCRNSPGESRGWNTFPSVAVFPALCLNPKTYTASTVACRIV